jgi:hypothetical protein
VERLDIWSMDKIIELLFEQSRSRPIENDESGILHEAARYIQQSLSELENG